MSGLGWLIVILMLLLVGTAVAVALWLAMQRKPVTTDQLKEFISNKVQWGDFTKGPDPTKNTCQIYTFPTTQVTYKGVPVFDPPTPSLNPSSLNSMTGTPSAGGTCLDVDQIQAQQVTRRCEGPDYQGERLTLCRRLDGTFIERGEKEVLYTSDNIGGAGSCTRRPRCPGQLALVAPGANINIFKRSCLKKVGTSTKLDTCAPVLDQLFRVTRKDPGVTFLTSANPQNDGLLATIFDRMSGLYLNAGTDVVTTKYFPPGGQAITFSGQNLVWTSDATFNWLVLPPLEFCSNPGGCFGNSCGATCHTEDNSSTCIPDTSNPCTTNFANLITPPQLVYIGRINFSTAPILNQKITEYKDLVGFSALLQWLSDNGARTLYYGGNFPDSGTDPVLIPLMLNSTVVGAMAAATQYINLDQYNTLIAAQVCLLGETVCYPL